ncbi:MAG: hypothetical protein EXS05_21450 [Planctomycetaceae bacterium]|nr:hypothetical protein [Planctomycetaceae bacterium]
MPHSAELTTSDRRQCPRRLWISLATLALSFTAAIESEPDDDLAGENVPQPELEVVVVNRTPPAYALVFGNGSNAVAARRQLDLLLRRKLNTVNSICRLTDSQKQKLQLAGRGDMKRLLDRLEEIGPQFQLAGNDQNKFKALVDEARLLQRSLNPAIHDDKSLFVKSLRATLKDYQFARYEAHRVVTVAGGAIQSRLHGPDEVVEINLAGSTIADGDLERLGKLSGVQVLALNGTRVTDAGLLHLKAMTDLKSLTLDDTQVTDAGLAHLSGLARLEWLSLANTRVTGGGLAHLKGLTSLQHLDLEHTQVTDPGLLHLTGLVGLKHLDLARTLVTNRGLLHLKGLVGLQCLCLIHTRVTDAGLEHLEGLTGLEEIWLPNGRVQSGRPRRDESAPAETPSADPMLGEEPGKMRDDNRLKIKLVWCRPGYLRMENRAKRVDDGALAENRLADLQNVEDGRPVKVLVSRGFWLGRYEITQGEWKQMMGTEPWKVQPTIPEQPDVAATHIVWNDAMEFCRRLTADERQAGRLSTEWEYTLPTEAQWERACRAGTETQFSFGDDVAELDEYAWSQTNSGGRPHPVGQKKPNPWGLYDMHGNVREWCRDVFVERLPGGRDPEVQAGGENRVCRGGNYYLPPASCRSASRDSYAPNGPIAFRLALSPIGRGNAHGTITEKPKRPIALPPR